MSLLVLDDQLSVRTVVPEIRKWTKAPRLKEIRPGETILDDRVPQILLTLRQPTFVTIDHHFWHPQWCHPSYSILYFALEDAEQALIPEILRESLHLPEFRTRATRMGKLARITPTIIDYWEYPPRELRRIPRGRRRRKR